MVKRSNFSWFVCVAALAACGTPAEEEDNPSGGSGTTGGGSGTPGGVSGGSGNSGGGGMTGGGGSVAQGGRSGSGGGGMSGGTGGAAPMGGASGGGAGTVATMCDSMEEPTGTCAENATGIFAIKTVIDVWWMDEKNPLPLIDPGRSTITVYLRGEISCVKPDGSGGVGVIKGCGTQLPPFKSDANCDAFQITFPDELWDKPDMPTFMTTGSTTGFEPGSILTLAEASGLIGVSLTDPDGAWPMTAAGGGFMTVDHDGDMNPGVTIKMGRIGETFTEAGMCGANLPFVFRGAPLDALGALDDMGAKAETLYIGVRTRIGGAGMIGASCDSGVGDSTATYLDSRVFGCLTNASPAAPCATAERDFVDNSAPNYHILKAGEKPPADVIDPLTGDPIDQTPSVGAKSGLVRLGDLGSDVSCAQVRGASFGL